MCEILGIDLGSLSVRIAHYNNGILTKLLNKEKNVWPCTISFSENKILFGTYGKNLENTITDHLELLGKTTDYRIIEDDTCSKAIVNEKNLLKYKVLFKNEEHEFFPEQITALILTNIVNSLNVNTKNCVLSIPSNFDPARRQAIINAANIAGLKVLRLINKPTAAALGYYYENELQDKPQSNLLIFHIGVSQFDVTIVELSNKNVNVRFSESSDRISKNVIDKLFFDYITAKFSINLNDTRKLRLLKNRVEGVKIELSSVCDSELKIDSERYEWVLQEDLNAAIEGIIVEISNNLITKALAYCNLTCQDINDIFLLGMSTNILKVKETIKGLFKGVGVTVYEFIKIEDLAAKGAAVLGAYLSDSDVLKNVKIEDLSFPIIQTKNKVLFDAQSRVPCRNFEESSQREIKVYSDNVLMRRYKLENILTRADVRVDFILTINGTLRINAIDNRRDLVVKVKDFSEIDESLLGKFKDLNVQLYEESRTSSIDEALINLQLIIVNNIGKIKSVGIDTIYQDIFLNIKLDVEEWKNYNSGLTKKMVLSKIKAVKMFLKFVQVNKNYIYEKT